MRADHHLRRRPRGGGGGALIIIYSASVWQAGVRRRCWCANGQGTTSCARASQRHGGAKAVPSGTTIRRLQDGVYHPAAARRRRVAKNIHGTDAVRAINTRAGCPNRQQGGIGRQRQAAWRAKRGRGGRNQRGCQDGALRPQRLNAGEHHHHAGTGGRARCPQCHCGASRVHCHGGTQPGAGLQGGYQRDGV